jgi:predicted TIM-barrel fold metal-dependent hydrolase
MVAAIGPCLLLAANGCTTVTPAPVPNPPPVVIDVHTHLFNAKYLPLRAIFVSRGVPDPASRILEKLLLAICDDSHLADPAARLPKATAVQEEARRLRERSARAAPSSREAVLREVFERHDLNKLLSMDESNTLADYIRKDLKTGPPREAGEKLSWREIANALEHIGLLSDEYPPQPPPKGVSPASALRFLGTLLAGERTISATLTNTYPSVTLFVNHMMDLEKTYAQQPAFAFSNQVAKMRALDGMNDGRTLTFVAFDPFRREQALPNAVRAWEQGAAGFKFYPPCGFRPANNVIPPRPTGPLSAQWDSRYQGLTADQLDAWNDAFFRFCASNGIPILTHCNRSGFEAVTGSYGQLMADPVHWRPVFAKHRNLRVCFAHAGGREGWFAGGGSGWNGTNFAAEVIRLCVQFTNAYCDVSYLEKTVTDEGLNAFRENLLAAFKHHPQFARQMMYGSDWHMLVMEDGHAAFLARFSEVFDHPDLTPHKADFFAGNAARFLRLDKLADDRRLSDSMRRHLKEVLNQIESTTTR